MKIVGITGGTGSGKTTLLTAVQQRGGHVIDCDAVYHRLLEQSPALQSAIAARFPDAMDGGVLDRKKLGAIVFAAPQALRQLNAITHCHVTAEVRRQLAQAEADGRQLAAIDAIALTESGLAVLCDVTVAVTAPEQARVQRLMQREGISEDYARSRIRAQRADGEFARCCDRTLVNDCASKEEFLQRCNALLDAII